VADDKGRLASMEADQAELDRRDKEFKRNWLKQQAEAYPQHRKSYEAQLEALDAEPKAEEPKREIPVQEPGHDPSRQEGEKGEVEAQAQSAGRDNRAPSDTTRQAAISSPPGEDLSGTAGEESSDDSKTTRRGAAK
jgi:hypothetical protein